MKNLNEFYQKLPGVPRQPIKPVTGVKNDIEYLGYSFNKELRRRIEELESNRQTCTNCGNAYLAHSHEHPCPYCSPNDREWTLKAENAKLKEDLEKQRLSKNQIIKNYLTSFDDDDDDDEFLKDFKETYKALFWDGFYEELNVKLTSNIGITTIIILIASLSFLAHQIYFYG